MRPLTNVSTGSGAPDTVLCPWRVTKVKAKSSSSSLLRHGMKDGNGETEEDSGS